MWTTERPRDL